MNEMENKAVEAIISPSFIDKMTSCSSLSCKYDGDTDDIHMENQKIHSKQQRRCLGSQIVPTDLSINGSMNILEDVVRCLLDKDTSALGFQIAQRSDGICISYVEPNGPADRSGNIFVGDKIKELTITFENMPISDALTILSCASTYKIRLELERAAINDAIQPDFPDTNIAEQLNNSANPTQQFSNLYKSYSTSDLALRLQKAQMSDKTVSGGSFMSKQKYQLPRQTIINTIREEAQSLASENLSSSNSYSNFTEKTEFASTMTESVISEETIIINDPLPALKNFRTSCNEISSQSQNPSPVITSKTSPRSNHTTSNSLPSNLSQQQTLSQIPISRNNDHTVLSLMPEENHKINEINYNGLSEFVERSHFMYSSANINNDIGKNCVEFCELIEPKRDSIVIEFEEDQKDDYYHQQNDEEMINLPNCNDKFDEEVENNLHQANSHINNNGVLAKIPPTSNTATINANCTEKDRLFAGVTVTSHNPPVNNEASDDRFRQIDLTENRKFGNFNEDISFSNNPEHAANTFIPSTVPNHTEINESNNKHMMKNSVSVVESPIISRKITNDNALPNENNERSPKRNQLRKLSDNGGTNEVAAKKEAKKLAKTIDDLKDEENNKSNISQRSPKWSPKLQSHIPVITRTPSTKSKNKLPKVEGNKTVNNSAHNRTTDDILKNDMNGASLYIAKKEALRKTYLPFSKINKSEEMDLNKERKARLEANQALLQRQQDELRTLGILP
ncbi:unnamed protein product [Acanthocheilonema viteae]|uniref:PDZ domain-containing protein n=1 Tax=Acanthocheilonema viteae TaxID=6277 RepID=A0A498SHI3_ACAVI|nr:unnamed protein product [Acanthocheilonema viteae]